MPPDPDAALDHAQRWLAEALAALQRRQARLVQAQAEVEAATEALLLAEIAINLRANSHDG